MSYEDTNAITTYEAPDITSAETAGTLALALMSEDEFRTRLTALKRGQERIQQIRLALLRDGEDYGIIPGTQKPTLYKAGAEKLCDFYRLRADFTAQEIVGDGETTPTVRYIVTCKLHLASFDGPIVACGLGMASSWERKYRYRRGVTCPTCGNTETMRRDKNSGGWYCWQKIGGCAATFADNQITQQNQENPDQWDLATTLLKMAEKRSFIDATLRACAASGLFTQDIEDSAAPAVTPAQEIDKPAKTRAAKPVAETELTGGMTVAQWGMLKNYCDKAGVTPDPTLTREAANEMINDLKALSSPKA